MIKRLSLVTLMAPGLLLSGCGGSEESRGLETVHQPVVSRTDFVFDVNADSGRLSDGEAARLGGWLASLRLGYGDKVAIDDPSGVADSARPQVDEIVQRYGLFLADHAPITGAAPIPGAIRIVVTRTTASVPGCPDFSQSGSHEFEGKTTSNHGCAINSNLAAMVARPEDLVLGRPGAITSDPATGTHAIQALRRGAGSGGTGTTGAPAGGATTGGATTGGDGGSGGGSSGGGN